MRRAVRTCAAKTLKVRTPRLRDHQRQAYERAATGCMNKADCAMFETADLLMTMGPSSRDRSALEDMLG